MKSYNPINSLMIPISILLIISLIINIVLYNSDNDKNSKIEKEYLAYQKYEDEREKILVKFIELTVHNLASLEKDIKYNNGLNPNWFIGFENHLKNMDNKNKQYGFYEPNLHWSYTTLRDR